MIRILLAAAAAALVSAGATAQAPQPAPAPAGLTIMLTAEQVAWCNAQGGCAIFSRKLIEEIKAEAAASKTCGRGV